MNHLLTILLLSLIAFGLCFKGLSYEKLRREYLWLFFAIFIVDQLLARLPKILPVLNIIGGHYNWTGKILATLFSIMIIIILKKKCQLDFAFTMKQLPGSVQSILGIVIGFFVLQMIYVYFSTARQEITWEDHLFQLTLPGISEEIMFRGILLGLLNGVFISRIKFLGAYLGWGTLVTALLFGIWHGISFDKDLHFELNYFKMISPLLVGFLLAWVRERTKSILFPFMYHSFFNESINIISMIK
jgi:uncharacterized protein